METDLSGVFFSLAEVLLHLKNYRDELLNKSLIQQQELQQADGLLRTIRDQPGAYQVYLSIYYHY
ncbi:MAG: hypothetical protein JWP57_3428 [Spirosoma sp.]|nr:hypothetical protein [Spirosoma sp.]